jgi:hypothetical protein
MLTVRKWKTESRKIPNDGSTLFFKEKKYISFHFRCFIFAVIVGGNAYLRTNDLSIPISQFSFRLSLVIFPPSRRPRHADFYQRLGGVEEF